MREGGIRGGEAEHERRTEMMGQSGGKREDGNARKNLKGHVKKEKAILERGGRKSTWKHSLAKLDTPKRSQGRLKPN